MFFTEKKRIIENNNTDNGNENKIFIIMAITIMKVMTIIMILNELKVRG